MKKNYVYQKHLKDSMKAIEKMAKEIERHPENKELLNAVATYTLEKRSFTDFRVERISREDFLKDGMITEKRLVDNLKDKDSDYSYYFCYQNKEGMQCDDRKNVVLQEEEGVTSKVVAINSSNELIFFLVEQRVKFTKEEKRIIKKFFGEKTYNH